MTKVVNRIKNVLENHKGVFYRIRVGMDNLLYFMSVLATAGIEPSAETHSGPNADLRGGSNLTYNITKNFPFKDLIFIIQMLVVK